MSEEFQVVLDAMFAEQVGEDGLKEYARTVASVAEWSAGRPADEVLQALTQGWSAVDLNVDPVEGEKLAEFLADPDHGDFTVSTADGTQLYRHSEATAAREASGADAEVADAGGARDTEQSAPGAAADVDAPEGPPVS